MTDLFSILFYPVILFVVPSAIYYAAKINVLLLYSVLGFTVPFFGFYPTILMIVLSLIFKRFAEMRGDADGSRRMKFARAMAEMWWIIARVYHGYEVRGLEKIPPGGALIVYYHGMVPIDVGYVAACFIKFRGQILEGIVDKTLFRIPGMTSMTEVMGATCRSRDYCTQRLKDGHYMSVSPGGAHEMMFSSNYSIEWKERIGFAKMAKESGKPIVPMFTENIRQYSDMITFGQRELIDELYNKYRFPVCVAFGGYPVKLRTHFGEALYCGPEESAENFAGRVRDGVEELIKSHQKRPGSIAEALAARFIS